MGTAKLNNDKKSLELFREKIKGKCLMDDKFMSVVFKDFPECVELVLRIILKIPDLVVNKAAMQLTMTNLLGRTVRIDVFASHTADTTVIIRICVRCNRQKSLNTIKCQLYKLYSTAI